MSAQQLLHAIGNACGLNNLTFDAQGCARLLIDGKLAIQLEHHDTDARIYLYSPIGTVPPTDRETVFRQLLEANLFGQDTADATLAVDKHRNDIIIWQAIAVAQADPNDMADLLERFIGAAETWQERLAAAPSPDGVGGSRSHADMSGAVRV